MEWIALALLACAGPAKIDKTECKQKFVTCVNEVHAMDLTTEQGLTKEEVASWLATDSKAFKRICK